MFIIIYYLYGNQMRCLLNFSTSEIFHYLRNLIRLLKSFRETLVNVSNCAQVFIDTKERHLCSIFYWSCLQIFLLREKSLICFKWGLSC